MNDMIRKLLLSAMLAFAVAGVSAENYNAQQERLRTEVADFLRGKGLSPEKQSDGLTFTKGKYIYYIEIDEDETAPMYIRLRGYFKYNENMTREKVVENLNDYNGTYGIKVLPTNDRVVLSAELFVSGAKDFTGVFDMLLENIEFVHDKINK